MGRAKDPDGLDGLFGPESITWRVGREAVLLLGGGRALLMQVAHPLVAAGVADHSDFRADPLGRLRRTLDAVLTVAFGSSSEARAAARRVQRIHDGVRGSLAEDGGRWAARTPYAANDPELLLWVHATLVDTAVQVYERYVGPLSAEERARYYEESKVTARAFGVPKSVLPPTMDAFSAYLERTIAALTVTATARDIAASVLRPAVALVPSALFDALSVVTAGLLPERLRRDFGLPWNAARRIAFEGAGAALRWTLPVIPGALRHMPAARAAERRLAARSCPSGATENA